MTESYLHILVEAKNEYTGQLASILTSPMYEGVASIYEHAKKTSKVDNLLIQFQELLSRIPNWNTETLEKEFQRIMLFSRCDWISDLITAVFVSHTKVLSSILLLFSWSCIFSSCVLNLIFVSSSLSFLLLVSSSLFFLLLCAK